jgi:hypothetical protein
MRCGTHRPSNSRITSSILHAVGSEVGGDGGPGAAVDLSAVGEFAMVGAEEGPGDNGAEMVFLREDGGGVRFDWGVGLGRGRGDLSGHKDDDEEDGMNQGLRGVRQFESKLNVES